MSGGIGAYQIGMLDYRSSLSLSSKIGTGTLSSIGGGALIGSAYGGPWGAAGGALIGAGFVAGEYIYNGAKYIWNETLWQISNFENAIKSGWYPGR